MSANKQTHNRHLKKPRSNFQRLSRRFMSGLLRSLFSVNYRTRHTQGGFVLPTTVLLLLMMTLTAGALSFRSFSRTQSVIAQREQEVIVGAATPAVDRAKAKIEYLFANDPRFPGGLPTSNKLQAMMRNVTNTEANGSNNTPLPGTDQDSPPYTLPDETRLDINNDGTLDNAWSFRTDIDGDGSVENSELVVYSVIMDDAQEIPLGDPTNDADVRDVDDPLSQDKANALVNRNAPIDTATTGNNCPSFGGGGNVNSATRDTNSQGWEVLDNVNLLKNFQIDAFVINDKSANRTISALEFQQVRQAVRGNRWGAWFKNDLEVFPGPNFTWNGAMHTEGSVFLGNAPNMNLISAYASCLYPDPTASEITLASNSDGSFQGQFVIGKLGRARNSMSGYGAENGSPTVDWSNGVGNTRGELAMSENNDSVDEDDDSLVTDVALDPVQVFTADISVHRNPNRWTRWADWENSDITSNAGDSNARVIDDPNSNIPFLDDLYRADGRYGPKASYNSNLRLSNANGSSGVAIGETIPSGMSALVDPINGLDGYWERQAIREGLRIIGGERIELGNPTVWKGVRASSPQLMDSLYPYSRTISYHPTNNNLRDDQSIRLHRLTLRDNLAAVQGMAVYHAAGPDGGDFPLMCMSMASHPGTSVTRERSTKFSNVSIGGTTTRDIDFFNGFGTNGWEYGPPLANESSFATAYNSDTSGLKKALENLAYFAGDPLGGAPSFTPVQDEHIHPYPTMSMWGDFSHLRRLLDSSAPDNLASVAYTDLSPADQAYVHTAACTLGMLANNIDTIGDFTFSDSELDEIVAAFDEITVPDVRDPYTARNNYINDSDEFNLPTSPHAFVSTLQTWADNSDFADIAANTRIAQLARIFHLKYQIQRDRQYGFASSILSTPYVTLAEHTLDSVTTIPANSTIYLGMDVLGDQYGLGASTTLSTANEEKFLRLATLSGGIAISDSLDPVAASSNTPPTLPLSDAEAATLNIGNPQFPSLFYLFPTAAHNHLGAGGIVQPTDELYINDDVDVDATTNVDDLYVQTANNGFTYNALSNSEIEGIEVAPTATGSWISPIVSVTSSSENVIDDNGTLRSILLLDKGYMNGREMINSRVIDIDVNLATTTTADSGSTNLWIMPNTNTVTGGIVYAFREDARREDAIVRPFRGYDPADNDSEKTAAAEAAWTTCSTNITAASCLMQFDYDDGTLSGGVPANSPYSATFDPPLRRETGNNNTYISPKPVDYFADPFRRPHGFRLFNGATLNRPPTVTAGLSFITDNVVLIKGDFNLHRNAGGTEKQEFDELLVTATNGAVTDPNFYTNRSTRSTTFANPAGNNDTWRPVEIVGDAVTIVSGTFNDGVISDAFQLPRASGDGGGTSSYQATLRPKGNGGSGYNRLKMLPVAVRTPSLFRENPYDGFALDANPANDDTRQGGSKGDSWASPVKVWRDANFRGEQQSITGDILKLSDGNLRNLRRRDLMSASSTTVNALIITGVVPSRGGQSNGGLHNHPRFLEHWDINGVTMKIAGGFFQLNYSTSATAPFDQKSNVWEPTTDAPDGNESISYYGAPRRIWGYDVALQFVPAGPVSDRFVTIGSPRSEYYQEVPADDPYITNLQCAEDEAGNKVVTNTTVTCPT